MSRFLEALHSGRVLLMDGAMGTELQRAGIQPGECYEAWNLTHPDRVAAIHQAYVDAGAEVLLTNTFQANPAALGRHSLENQLEPILQAAGTLARSVAGPDRFVLGSFGPLPTEVGGDDAQLRGWFERVLRVSEDLDGLLLETFTGRMADTAAKLLLQMRGAFCRTHEVPVLLSLAFGAPIVNVEDVVIVNHSCVGSVPLGASNGIAVLGMNCGREIGMDSMIDLVRGIRLETELPLLARPNAGTPTRDGDRWVYPHTPALMAERLPELLEAGVSMVGGCCGTTPEHIAAFRPIVAAWNARKRSS